MKFYLTENACLKWLERPFIYNIKKDELYEIDEKAFKFLTDCHEGCDSPESEFINFCIKEDLLTEKEIRLKRPPILKSPEPSLRYLELQITERCNLRCRHCYIKSNRAVELSFEQIKKVLREFEELQGLRVLISGGEPLMHPDFEKINKSLPEFFIRKVLFTNGILIDRKLLKNLNIDEIQISIDGLEKGHDALRGKGTFKKAMDALELAIEEGFDVSVATMVHSKNLDQFDEMERLFKSLGVKEWNVDVPCSTGRLKEHRDFQLRPEVAGKYLRYGFGGGIHDSLEGYACGLHLMAVMADGRIAKCTFYGENPVGTIEDGLKVCWSRIRPIRLEELKCDCEYMDYCRGGCRYRALIAGDEYGIDPFRCEMYKEG
ncbi:MAG: radical SAM protein [Thermodesulfovibrionales bacterium]|nr:radical SAM protein [Thermodesulfovibrionales bacterium]